jgi:hypothetical protein
VRGAGSAPVSVRPRGGWVRETVASAGSREPHSGAPPEPVAFAGFRIPRRGRCPEPVASAGFGDAAFKEDRETVDTFGRPPGRLAGIPAIG